MPRLNNFTYYAHHYFVNEVWVKSRNAWAKLSPGEQWDLHCFYSARHSLSTEQLKEFRKQAVVNDPSLPQRAGRALKKLEAAYALHVAKTKDRDGKSRVVAKIKTKRLSKDHVITMKSIVHPEPDVERMAKALLALAEEMAAAERVKKANTASRSESDHDAET